MITSESIKQISPALLQAQKDITFATKESTNPHFRSKYASLSSVIDAIKPALNNAGIVFLQFVSPSDDERLNLTTRLIHTSGEFIEDTATCPLAKQDAQGFGSALTYLRRYTLATIIGLYQDDDDGQTASLKADDFIKRISTSQSLAELEKNYLAVLNEVKNDKLLTQMVIKEKDKMKEKLNVTK